MEDHEQFWHEKPVKALNGRAFIVLCIMSAVAVGCFIAALVTPALSHEAPATVAMPLGWSYPAICCSNRDCAPIPDSAVKTGPDGYRVTLMPGDHPFVDTQVSYLIPYKEAKDSPDGIHHICLNPDGKMLCFFSPPRGF